MGYMDQYEAWLRDFSFDQALVEELSALKGHDKEIEDRFYTELSFGTGGMRGVLGAGTNRMNVYNVRRLSAGMADYFKALPGACERGVVIGYDSRRLSAEFAKQAALTYAARGIKAYLFDALRPVPIISYAIRHLKAIAGVAVTASHNPPNYNGYKAYAEDGAQIAPQTAKAISDKVFSLKYSECEPMDEQEALQKGLLKIIGNREVDDDYMKMVLGLMVQPELVRKEGGKLKIVYTPLHGSGNVPVRRALREAGITQVTVVPEQELPDPAFPTVSAPNPENPEAFKLAIPLAEKVGASVIFGTDPDCDRLGVCVKDGQGKFVTLTGNQIGMLLLYHILDSRQKLNTLPKNGACIKSIVSTQMAKPICAAYGVQLFDVLTGFKFIGEMIQQFEQTGSHSFLFGFEESYGYLSGTKVRDKDGVNASLLIAEAACVCMAEGITLYERLQQLYARFGYYHEAVISKTLPGKDGLENMRAIMKRLRENPPAQVAGMKVLALRDYLRSLRFAEGREEPMPFEKSDVLYFELPNDSWFCIRPSGTEPKIKLYVNTRSGTSMADAEQQTARLLKACEELLK